MVIQGKSKLQKKQADTRPSPVSSISKIASLKRYADKDYALDLLHQMARAVAPIIHEYKFKVGTLCEMYPKSPNLLGLNVNRGQKILIRLRPPHNDRTFFPMSDLIGTFLHELTHNVHGPHDAKFYKFLDELRRKYETGTFKASDYVCEENTLGSGFRAPWSTPQSVRQIRLEALSKGKFKAESRRVGGKAPAMGNLRKAMLEAAERRLKDSKWCSQSKDVEIIDDDDLEIQDFAESERESDLETDQKISTNAGRHCGPKRGPKLDRESGTNSKPVSTASTANTSDNYNNYKDVIDLTREDIGDDEIEIIAVDACENDHQYPRIKTLRPSMIEESTFSASPETSSGTNSTKFEMKSTVRYVVSSSPGRTFIGGDSSSQRRKIVADLNFDHIIESTAFVRVQKTPPPNNVLSDQTEAVVRDQSGEDLHGTLILQRKADTKTKCEGNEVESKSEVKRQKRATRTKKPANSESDKNLKSVGKNAKAANAPRVKKGSAKTHEKKDEKSSKQEGKSTGAAKKKRQQKEVRCVSFQELFMN